MEGIEEPIEIKRLERLNKNGLDDLFICAASFEERCLSSVFKLADDFRTRFSIIFLIEEPTYKEIVSDHLNKLKVELSNRTSERLFFIPCQRQNPMDGLTQFREIWNYYQLVGSGRSFITIDISGFTKIYILELLYYLVKELGLPFPRIIHTTQKYRATKLTKGVESEIMTIPHFSGNPSPEKNSLLVLFLGFESERVLRVWEHIYPLKTIVLMTNPPREKEYQEYVLKHNAYLLSRPSVKLIDDGEVPPDNPYKVSRKLEEIFIEYQHSFNLIIGPFGTKSQVVGIFLFWLRHPEVQVIYSFPVEYTRSYLGRKPGTTLLLPLGP